MVEKTAPLEGRGRRARLPRGLRTEYNDTRVVRKKLMQNSIRLTTPRSPAT